MEINGLPVGVSGPENISSSPLFSGLNQSQAFKLQSFGSEEDAMTAFRNGRLRAVIVVPQDFEESLQEGNGSTVRIVVDNSDLALEQAVLAALSSVIEASSADITRSYVSAAWLELRGLNASAASLASNISSTRANMQQTKEALEGIRKDIDSLGMESLEQSLDNASAEMAGLQALMMAQKATLANVTEADTEMLNRTDAFLLNASAALNESIATVQSTHQKLSDQVTELNDTIHTLDLSIAGLEAIKAGISDNTTIAALELNIASLQSLRNATYSQMLDAQTEMAELESLNDTLNSFGLALTDYSAEVETAKTSSDKTAQLADTLDNASLRLHELNSSFAGARSEVGKLKGLLSSIKNATSQIESTLDDALTQTAAVDSLISSLQGTVAEQTGKDPGTIASPLSVKVENQYERGSFVDFIMPQVIAVSLLLSCFLLGSISLVREKTRRTIVRALMVPGGLVNLVAGKIAALVLLSFGQVMVILLVALLLFGVKPPENIAMLVWGTAISALVLSSIGALVGFYARSESAAIQSCLLLAIPMLFLGNIIFSPDLLPSYTQILQQLLPLAHVTSIFKIILITNGDPALDIAALLSYFVLLLALMAYIVIRRKDITNYI
jgi:ABC-type multidrug transport system permease subunit